MQRGLRWMAMSWRAASLPPFLPAARVRSVSVRPLKPFLGLEREDNEEVAEEGEATGPDVATRRPRLRPPRRAPNAAGTGTCVIQIAMLVSRV